MNYDRLLRRARAFFGRRVRGRRAALGLSRAELAGRSGLSEAKIRACEAGSLSIRLTQLRDLAQALEVPPAFFLESEEEAATREEAHDRR